ncbi:hypothetical protein JTB14_014072 [Gonioctena quinquepunctata]|nr:hypothetical protein JTB14_014072 [Gonioctena quinquepunctata]
MLETLSKTTAKMQADEIEAIMCKQAEIPANTITFENDMCSPIVKEEQEADESNAPQKSPIPFEEINLEDDIEKIEETSHESSDEMGESDLPEKFKQEPDQALFSGIPTQNPSESIKSWLQRITDMQNEILQKKFMSGNSQSLPNRTPVSTMTNMTTSIPQTPNRVVKFQDLPYMGEMTLDNSKPRRGRKPKKADICHLIYKNYGTIFPGTPNPGSYLEKETKKTAAVDIHDSANRNDVQHKIISSLLERRLTQENGRSKEMRRIEDKKDQNEPLNLCIRDLNHLKIRLMKNHDNTYTSEIKSEPQSDDDIEIIQESPSPSISSKTEPGFPPMSPATFSTPSPDPVKTGDGAAAGGYVYWPNAGVFIHPVALQQQLMLYQKMAGGNSYVLPGNQGFKVPLEENAGSSKTAHASSELRKLMPKVVKSKTITPKVHIEETDSPPISAQELKKRNASSSHPHKMPTKRKRSAIFIPPIPTENNTNPATEVSICKFKFTGGAKPSLQEKKMLSVDSGGNFRYYSGTGDKSMRGYEFFPRETLQQQISNSQGSSTGAFLKASGEKIYPSPPVDFTGAKSSSSEFLLSPELPAATYTQTPTSTQDQSHKMKKRKSRKSLQREKLEQTFKEKGFLIQTQQTESAEGATYCKFRQLRKFTRYLFRSWKDYLPGNLGDGEQPRCLENGEVTVSELDRDNADTSSINSGELPNTHAQ